MANYVNCKDHFQRLMKARVPFITFKTNERDRALELIKESQGDLNLPIYTFSLSEGLRDINTNQKISEDSSLASALAFAIQLFTQRQNTTLIFPELPELESDSALARQMYDIVHLASTQSNSLVVLGCMDVWTPLQRLGMSTTLDLPNEEEVYEIIQEFIEPHKTAIKVEWTDADYSKAATVLANLSKLEIENLLATNLAKGSLTVRDLETLSLEKDKLFNDVAGIERVNLRKDDLSVGGLTGLRTWLKRERDLDAHNLKALNLRPSRGILLVGVPGCGKSLSAKAIAAEWNRPLYRLDLANIHGQYLGQSERRLKESLQSADHVSPCVLWIDEIEKGLAGAGSQDGGTTNRLVGHFLYWLQESTANVFVVATANNISALPPELFRKGRFDEIFFVDLPDIKERTEIISIYVSKYLKDGVAEGTIQSLAERSEGFSGADLEACMRDIAKESLLNGGQVMPVDAMLQKFEAVIPYSRTNPVELEYIRKWGYERALPATGSYSNVAEATQKFRRIVV